MSFDIIRGTYSVNKLLVPLSNAALIKQRVYRRLNISLGVCSPVVCFAWFIFGPC